MEQKHFILGALVMFDSRQITSDTRNTCQTLMLHILSWISFMLGDMAWHVRINASYEASDAVVCSDWCLIYEVFFFFFLYTCCVCLFIKTLCPVFEPMSYLCLVLVLLTCSKHLTGEWGRGIAIRFIFCMLTRRDFVRGGKKKKIAILRLFKSLETNISKERRQRKTV